MSKASGSVLDHLHVTALLSKLYNGEAMFTKSGANLRRKFVDPKDDRNSDTLVEAPHLYCLHLLSKLSSTMLILKQQSRFAFKRDKRESRRAELGRYSV